MTGKGMIETFSGDASSVMSEIFYQASTFLNTYRPLIEAFRGRLNGSKVAGVTDKEGHCGEQKERG